MLQKFTKHISSNFPFLKEKKLLIAISGGLDSVVLTHLLTSLNFNVSLAHCNFKLREKESDLDENFVINLSQNHLIRFLQLILIQPHLLSIIKFLLKSQQENYDTIGFKNC